MKNQYVLKVRKEDIGSQTHVQYLFTNGGDLYVGPDFRFEDDTFPRDYTTTNSTWINQRTLFFSGNYRYISHTTKR